MIFKHESLRRVGRAIFGAAGSEGEEPGLVTDHLVDANLAGHDSHGVRHIPGYVGAARDGRAKLNRHAKLVKDSGTILVLEGDCGFGQVIGRETMALGIERVRETGLCMIALRNSYHLGRIGAWAEMCSGAGFASVHFVNILGSPPVVAPFGGAEARMAPNPVSASVPTTRGAPIVLDIATSKIAEGKVGVALSRGVGVPEGSLIDAHGNPTTDPGALYTKPPGAILPMGEHKGFGLCVISELLAGAVGGGGTLQPRSHNKNEVNNMLSFIVDPAAIGEVDLLRSEIDGFVAWVKASPPARGAKEVLMPGEMEWRTRQKRAADGIPIDDKTWEQILEIADVVGLKGDDVSRMASS